MKTIKTRTSPDKMDLESLWSMIKSMSSHIAHDNTLYDGEYPLGVREMQLESIQVLLKEIEACHNKLKGK